MTKTLPGLGITEIYFLITHSPDFKAALILT